MTASAGAWYRVGTVNVVGGSQSVVGVDTNWKNDVIAIAIGDIFTLDAKTWYEVTAVNSDTSITLDRGFEGSTVANKTYAILRNTSGTILTRIAGQVSVQFNQKQLFLDELRTWLNSDNAAEELTDSHGLKQSLKTPSQMVRDHDSKLAELDAIHPYPYAMRKVEFEARRAANNEKFAASGFVHFGKQQSSSSYGNVNEGLWTLYLENTTNRFVLGARESDLGSSKTNYPTVNIAGVTTGIYLLGSRSEAVLNLIKLPPAENGTRTYDSATGVSVTHATPAIAFASETATNKVVTDRVDMWGFEAFLREINDADPFVYANGLIQSLAPNINGVTTVTDNVRPATYFAWYEGDDSSTGKGVNWQTATEAQRMAIASNPDNNIYFDDETGSFYQWCIRGRSFAGAGNGDWGSIESSLLAYSVSSPVLRVRAQGTRSDYPELGAGSTYYYSNSHSNGAGTDNGVYVSRGTSGSSGVEGVNGDCYFLVCGTVNRLNQGAYHPSFNASGSAVAVKTHSDGTVRGAYWYDTNLPITQKAQCFNNQAVASPNPTQGSYDNTGSLQSLSSTPSGRPDGRFYDAIYAIGQGGVCRDMRYSACGLTQEDFAEADLKVKSGEYRGREKLPFSVPILLGENTTTSYLSFGDTKPKWWDKQVFGGTAGVTKNSSDTFLVHPSTGEKLYIAVTGYTTSSNLGWHLRTSKSQHISDGAPHGLLPGEVLILQTQGEESLGKTSIADEYTHTEVIGDPANILLCDDLKDGWVGSWNPKIPDSGGDTLFPFTKPCLSSPTASWQYTSDSGVNWSSNVVAVDGVKNSASGGTINATGNISVINYKTKAVMTEDSANSAIHGGVEGLGQVFATSYFATWYGAGLGFSLIEKVLTQAGGSYAIDSVGLYNNLFNTNGAIASESSGSIYPANTHSMLRLEYLAGDSPAFKALNYNVAENQQGFINYAYTELTHNGTDWGDDSKINITDNQSTRLDDNGNTVLYGTARVVEPLGWIKNDK